MKNIKYCFQCDGTEKGDHKIAQCFEKLGIKNFNCEWRGEYLLFYFVGCNGDFQNSLEVPRGYALVHPDDFLKGEPKYCFKADGTRGRGVKIIKALEKLGGKSMSDYKWQGTDEKHYYYVDDNNHFSSKYIIPCGYTLAEPDDILNEYPKEMYVSDNSEELALKSKTKRIIVAEVNYQEKHCFIAIGSDESKLIAWEYAVDIPKSKESEVVELTLGDVAAKFNIPIDKLRIIE